MSSLRANFFADDSDISDLFSSLKSLGEFRYVESQSATNEALSEHLDPMAAKEDFFGSKFIGSKRKAFFVLDKNCQVEKRKIKLTDGTGIKEKMDQYSNPDSIGLSFGGEFSNNMIVMSSVGTIGDTERSREMFTLFRKLMMSKTVRVGEKGRPYHLMPGVINKLKQGWRLSCHGNGFSISDPIISPDDLVGL